MEKLQQLIEAGNVTEILVHCEVSELSQGESGPSHGAEIVYSVHLLAYLLDNDLNNARFLWKRMPEVMKGHIEVKGVWDIAQSLWNRDQPRFYVSTAALNWSPLVAPLISSLVDSVRDKTFARLSLAYSTLSVQEAAAALGLTMDSTIELALSRGWSFDGDAGIFRPKEQEQELKHQTGLKQLDQLAGYVLHLEKLV